MAAIEFIGTALDILATEKFKGIYAEIAHADFHKQNLEFSQTPSFSWRLNFLLTEIKRTRLINLFLALLLVELNPVFFD